MSSDTKRYNTEISPKPDKSFQEHNKTVMTTQLTLWMFQFGSKQLLYWHTHQHCYPACSLKYHDCEKCKPNIQNFCILFTEGKTPLKCHHATIYNLPWFLYYCSNLITFFSRFTYFWSAVPIAMVCFMFKQLTLRDCGLGIDWSHSWKKHWLLKGNLKQTPDIDSKLHVLHT